MKTYQGNCDLCFLKKTIKIKTIHQTDKSRAAWWARLEEKTGQLFRKDRFSYQDLRDGKVPLDLVDNGEEQQTCFCHD